MDYKEQIRHAKNAAVKWREKHQIVGVGELRVDCIVDDLTMSITDLLSRAEAAEVRCAEFKRSAERWERTSKNWEHNWSKELEIRKEAEDRAQKAEAENAVLRRMQPVKIDGDTLELAAEVSELKNKLAKVEKARNTAISDLERIKSCAVCRHCDSLKNPIPIVCKKCHNGDKWEWRGQKEE